jgi:hypothetical protein
MVYSFFMEPVKHVIRNSVDLVIPSNSFIAMVTGSAGYLGSFYGGAFSQEKINNIIWNKMNCSKKDSGAEFVAMEIGKALQKKVLESLGASFANIYDTFAGGEGMKTLVNEMAQNITADFSQIINCASANAVALAITPHLSEFSINYYYPIKFMIITSISLNLVAIALFKVHSYCKKCCMTTEQLELAIEISPIKAIQAKTEQESPKELALAESKLFSREEYHKKMGDEHTEMFLSLTQPLQKKLDTVTANLEILTSTLVNITKKIEETNSNHIAAPITRRQRQKAN